MRASEPAPESGEWRQARRTAFVEEVLAVLTQRPADLLSFDHVHEKLQLNDVRYLDLQHVPLDRIVGSVGRYGDFTRAFCPRQDHLQGRWERIPAASHHRAQLASCRALQSWPSFLCP